MTLNDLEGHLIYRKAARYHGKLSTS